MTYIEIYSPALAIEVVELAHQASTAQSVGSGNKK